MSKQVMQQALDHLVNLQPIFGNGLLDETQLRFVEPHIDKAIKALEAELAKPEQEPVVWVSLIQEAQAIVEGKYLFKRFIDGTPLSNDIAVWMTKFALKYAAPPRKESENPDGAFIDEGSKPEQCDWNYDDDGMWQTGCGKELSFEMHHPEESVKFCQGCGKPAHFVEPSEGEKECRLNRTQQTPT